MSKFVRVSRKWNSHTITHTVIEESDGIRIEASLEEFLVALAKETGMEMFTKRREKAMLANMDKVIQDMKDSTRFTA